MTLIVYEELEQGSDSWFDARRGLISASELNLVLTPTLKVSNNENTRKHVFELAAQRLSAYTEPSFVGDAMLRGWTDEILARDRYSAEIAPVLEVGGMCRDFGKFKLWASPDGLIGDDEGLEVKSRMQKHHLATIEANEVPSEYMLQIQANLLVSGRAVWNYVSYCGGWPMWIIRVEPDPAMQAAIVAACESFEEKVRGVIWTYNERLAALGDKVIMTDREIEQEVYLG